MSEMTDETMTPKQLADFLQVPLGTIYQWRHKGQGPRGSKVGRHVRYRQTDVDEWLDRRSESGRGSLTNG
jgi:excisionase family DNA binding protein